MTPSELAVAIAPFVLLGLVATVVRLRRSAAAGRYLASTISMGTGSSSVRYPCGLNVDRPGRLGYDYPDCEVAVLPKVLVVFGPTGTRVAEIRKGSPRVLNLRHRLLWELSVTSPSSRVTLAVADEAADAVRGWMQELVT